ncbi:MAG: hypothetical protein GXN93_00720 [Candidatus Diapherotrites archaeon]|nr:hypothetical protein [Candidatus Diapherotrites archaeon]
MDPVARSIADLRALRSAVQNPFDRDAVKEYFCKMGDDLGFKSVKNYRQSAAHIDCAWKDGTSIFAAINIEYGSTREILGAIAETLLVHPEISVIVTASNPMKPVDHITTAMRAIRPGNTNIVLDVNGRATVVNE